MVLKEGNMEGDEARYLASYNHSFKGLIQSKPQRPGFEHGGNLRRTLDFTWPVVTCFILTMAAFLLPRVMSILCILGVIYILFRLKCVLGVLLLSVLVGKIHKNHHERAVVYWTWFPCWKFLFCLLGSTMGGFVGHHLWETYWQQYSEISLLKAYRGIDPAVVPGAQIQDAGAVEFASTAGIDSEHAGCFMNAGRTYCIAPIVTNGTMLQNVGGAPRYGSYDYFAVGVDCCSCPDINFRCGAWRHPWAEGGIRSTDLEARPFYRLAVEAWASTYRKTSNHPLFFEWVDSPVAHRKSLRQNFWKFVAWSLLLWSLATFSLGFTLARLQQALIVHGWACPSSTPPPPAGFESAWQSFLPEMMESYKESHNPQRHGSTSTPDSVYGAVETSSSSA